LVFIASEIRQAASTTNDSLDQRWNCRAGRDAGLPWINLAAGLPPLNCCGCGDGILNDLA